MENVLITGGAGYVGSHIAELLIKKKFNVFIIDNLSTGYKKLINKKSWFYYCDLNDHQKVRYIIEKNKIDSIIHCAAKLSVEESQKLPKIYYKNNVAGTLKLINACKNTLVKNFIFSSTCAVYGSKSRVVVEKSKILPESNYGKTKFKAELLIKDKLKKINYCILRYFNVVGASKIGNLGQINANGQLFKNLSIQCLKKNPTINIFGNNYNTYDGTCIRDYIHVSDLADIHLKVLIKINHYNKSTILNCGYGKGYSVLDVVKIFKKISKKNIKINYLPRRQGDIAEIISNTKKLNKFLKWKPKYSKISIAVKSAIKWEKKLAI
jgi:UDP-glucose 4-epimerase